MFWWRSEENINIFGGEKSALSGAVTSLSLSKSVFVCIFCFQHPDFWIPVFLMFRFFFRDLKQGAVP